METKFSELKEQEFFEYKEKCYCKFGRYGLSCSKMRKDFKVFSGDELVKKIEWSYLMNK